MEKVCIQKGNDPYETTTEALNRVGFSVKGKKVLIKPNLTTSASATSGITTDVRVCEAIIDRLDDCQVIIAEGSGECDTMYTFEKNGYTDLAEKTGAKIVDFNRDEVIVKKIPKPIHYKKLPFPKTVFEVDYIIDVSKLKIHVYAGITLSLKNMFGCIPTSGEKSSVHPHINKAILDIAQIVYPHFCVIDGIVGNERHEVISHPVKSGIIIAGRDPLAVDMVGSRCMGVRPEKVEHLRRGVELFGQREIDVIGSSVEEVQKKYSR